MELPNDSTRDLNDEMEELYINAALDILLECAEDGDGGAMSILEKFADFANVFKEHGLENSKPVERALAHLHQEVDWYEASGQWQGGR